MFQQSKEFLEIPVEAVKNIPDDVKEKNPDVDWKNIAGLRDILIHAYFGIDDDIVWDVVENKIPELREEIERLITRLD